MQRVLLTFALAFTAFQTGRSQTIVSLRAGLLNYSEGRIETTDAMPGKPKAGAYHLRKGELLQTNGGRAELLLAPCVFLRLADGSQVQMDNDALGEAEVTLLRGSAVVEAVDLPKGAYVSVHLGDAVTEIRQPGIYRFDVADGEIRVFDGKAEIKRGATQTVVLRKGKVLALAAPAPVDFDRKLIDRTQRWSARRSLAVAQSNLVLAKTSYGQAWRRAARIWIWSVYLNAEAARSALSPTPTPSGF